MPRKNTTKTTATLIESLIADSMRRRSFGRAAAVVTNQRAQATTVTVTAERERAASRKDNWPGPMAPQTGSPS